MGQVMGAGVCSEQTILTSFYPRDVPIDSGTPFSGNRCDYSTVLAPLTMAVILYEPDAVEDLGCVKGCPPGTYMTYMLFLGSFLYTPVQYCGQGRHVGTGSLASMWSAFTNSQIFLCSE